MIWFASAPGARSEPIVTSLPSTVALAEPALTVVASIPNEDNAWVMAWIWASDSNALRRSRKKKVWRPVTGCPSMVVGYLAARSGSDAKLGIAKLGMAKLGISKLGMAKLGIS